MRDDLENLIAPAAPSPTIGERGFRLHQRAIRRRIDFYIGGKVHAFIVFLPLIYGTIQVQRGQVLEPWFWWTLVGSGILTLIVHRPPFLRLTPKGIIFPARNSPLYPWNQMAEAHSRTDEMGIVLASGEHVKIPYQKLRRGQVEKLKRLIKSQFLWMSQQGRAEAAVQPATPIPAPAPVSAPAPSPQPTPQWPVESRSSARPAA